MGMHIYSHIVMRSEMVIFVVGTVLLFISDHHLSMAKSLGVGVAMDAEDMLKRIRPSWLMAFVGPEGIRSLCHVLATAETMELFVPCSCFVFI